MMHFARTIDTVSRTPRATAWQMGVVIAMGVAGLLSAVIPVAIGLASEDGPAAGVDRSRSAPYEIVIRRTGKDSGTLAFYVREDGQLNKKFETRCWWDPKNVIPAKTYTGCSTTTMKMKKHHAVYLPDEQTGKKGIFIHPGASPKDSTGCIVIAKDKIEAIYRTVPRNEKNITVKVIDPK